MVSDIAIIPVTIDTGETFPNTCYGFGCIFSGSGFSFLLVPFQILFFPIYLIFEFFSWIFSSIFPGIGSMISNFGASIDSIFVWF